MAPFESLGIASYLPFEVKWIVSYLKRDIGWKITIFFYPMHSIAPLGGPHVSIVNVFVILFGTEGVATLRWKSLRICLAVLIEHQRVTDRRTDRLTDILPRHSPRYAYVSRGKNTWIDVVRWTGCWAAVMVHGLLYKRYRGVRGRLHWRTPRHAPCHATLRSVDGVNNWLMRRLMQQL